MPNTLTDLYPDIYAGLNIVAREMVGFIPAVDRNADASRAAIGQTVRVPVTTAHASAANTPGVTAPDTGDTTVNNIAIEVTKSKHVPIRFNGEETRGLQNAGTYNSIRADRFAQAFRTLVNEMETDVATAAYVKASRAFGTAGTAPFGTKDVLTDFAGVAQILDDNGCPRSERQLVAGSAAFYNLRGIQTGLLQRVNESGTAEALRGGEFGEVHGFAIRNSAQVVAHVRGTSNAGFDTNLGATLQPGATAIALDTGTGTILAGDTITFTGDTNRYVVDTAFAGGSLAIGAPGLRQTLADGVDATIGAAYRANLAFHRNAIVLLNRLPALPDGGDAAEDLTTVTDPVSGLTFEIAVYRQFLQTTYHVRAAWGVGVPNPAFVATLLG